MTSIASVEVAPDLKTCKAFISVLGDESAQKDTLAGLKSASRLCETVFGKKPESQKYAGDPFHS